MSGSSFGRQTIIFGVVSVVAMTVMTGSYLPIMFALMVAMGVTSYMMLSGRMGTDRPTAPEGVAPISDAANLEGRVDKMTVVEEETASTSWKPWEQTQISPVYIITISGLAYRLDPRPVLRGRYDWVNEGAWVEATFDRITRVVSDLRPTSDPTASK